MTLPAPGRPRRIRYVSRFDAKKQPKLARDRKTHVDIERITCRSGRPCAAKDCQAGGFISPGTVYARMYDHERPAPGFQPRGRRPLPFQADYHFACLPERAQRLRRFLEPKD